MSTPAPAGRDREYRCPECARSNGGLDFCSTCRFNDCENNRACCGQEAIDE